MAHSLGTGAMVPSVVARGEGSRAMGADAIHVAMQRGNINIGSHQPSEVLELSDASLQAQHQHAELLRRYEAQQRARSVIVPTAVEDVKAQLRALRHPITLFGEGHADRRVRLQQVIAEMELDATEVGQLQAAMNRVGEVPMAVAAAPDRAKETVYSTASDALIEARRFMAQYSFSRSHERLQRVKQLRESDELTRQDDEALAGLYKHSKEMALNGTQFGDERPLTCIRYSPDGKRLAAGSFSTHVQFFDAKTLDNVGTLRGHRERVTKLCWHPEAIESNPSPLLATAAADAKAILWNSKDGTPVHTFAGHASGISGIDFHPSGRVLGTVSRDTTMRLWDVEAGTELLLQDGHTAACGCIAFQPDGALALTGDALGIIHIWDLRSGQSVCPLQGHVKKITAAHFSSNSWQVATGSEENMVRIWDLRMKKTLYVLPAHSKLISDVRFSSSGELLLTSAFDGLLKLWGTRDFSLLRTLSGHTGPVMSCDIGVDERHCASAGNDRTVKLWAHKNEF